MDNNYGYYIIKYYIRCTSSVRDRDVKKNPYLRVSVDKTRNG